MLKMNEQGGSDDKRVAFYLKTSQKPEALPLILGADRSDMEIGSALSSSSERRTKT